MSDIEANLIGTCLLSEKPYWQVADLLTSDDFSTPEFAQLWSAMSDAARAQEAFDAISMMDRHPRFGSLPGDLANACFVGGNIRAHAEAIVRGSERRRFEQLRVRLAKAESPEEAYTLLSTVRPRDASSMKLIREHFRTSFTELQNRLTNEKPVVGLPSGIGPLDDLTGGWQPGNLIILAARPSVGKTAIALQFGLHASVQEKAPVLFFSQEQSGQELADRATSHLGRIPGDALRDPRKLADEHWPRITAAAATINETPLIIDDTAGQTIESITARCRQSNAERRLGLIVIDYLGLMKMPKADRHDLAVGVVTKALKALAKDLRVPILLLCQLNRNGTGRPRDEDLRDSGNIEQDADLILFLYRKDPENLAHTTLVLHKQRNGPKDDVELHSQMSLMRFDHDPHPPITTHTQPTRGFGRKAAA